MDDQVLRLLEQRRYSLALERLLDVYQSKVFRMALAFLHDPGRAEEVTQDIFFKLWRALPAYDGRASLGTWLYSIARNTCLSAIRSQSRRGTVPLDEVAEPSIPNTVSRDLELAQCIDRLPATQKQIIALFYLQDKSVDEVAQMLNLPAGTVKSHLHRARVALATMLKE